MILNERKIKWTLFTLMVMTVPVLYFALLMGGWLSLLSIAAMGLGNVIFGMISIAHLLVYGPIFYFVCRALARRLASMPERARTIIFVGQCGFLFALAYLPVYLPPFGTPDKFRSLYDATACAMRGARAC